MNAVKLAAWVALSLPLLLVASVLFVAACLSMACGWAIAAWLMFLFPAEARRELR